MQNLLGDTKAHGSLELDRGHGVCPDPGNDLGATGLVSANPEKKPSFPSRAPKRELDFILHSPELRVVHFQIPPVLYSDHAPLICDFEMR